MKEEKGLLYYVIIIVIIICIAIFGVMINKIAGKDGVVEKVVSVETNYNKEDVLDKINYTILQKFIELNNQSKTENKVLSEVYNENIIINYLKEIGYIEEIYNEEISNSILNNTTTNATTENTVTENVKSKFNINLSNIYSDGESYIKTGNYTLEKNEENKYVVIYTLDGETETIGELQIQQV